MQVLQNTPEVLEKQFSSEEALGHLPGLLGDQLAHIIVLLAPAHLQDAFTE